MTKSVARTADRQFWRVIDWQSMQYTERRNVPSPPWPWFRIQAAMLRSPEWIALTRPQRADFVAALGAASETGNMIPDDPRWLSTRSLTRRGLAALSRDGFVERFSISADDPQIKELRRILSGATPEKLRTQRAEGRGQISEKREESPDMSDQAPSRPNGKSLDVRDFEQIKTIVLDLSSKLATTDPDRIHKMGGASRRLSLKQCRVAVGQLLEDGRL